MKCFLSYSIELYLLFINSKKKSHYLSFHSRIPFDTIYPNKHTRANLKKWKGGICLQLWSICCHDK